MTLGVQRNTSLVDADTYLLMGQRYIELNPVRAAMVDESAHYPWSSYRHNALGETNRYLSPHPLYLALGNEAKTRHDYRSPFRAELNEDAISDLRMAINQTQPPGNSRFYAKIEAMTGQRREPRPRGRPRNQGTNAVTADAEQGELPC